MTTEGEMTNILYDYDHSRTHQRIEDLIREADKARLAKGARRNRRQRRQEASAQATLRPLPVR
jgi:hypothetical protein